jgi:hypothetical protein
MDPGIRIRAKLHGSATLCQRFGILDIELANKFLKVHGTTVLCLTVIYLWFRYLYPTYLKVYLCTYLSDKIYYSLNF